jgi:hypothetical protein
LPLASAFLADSITSITINGSTLLLLDFFI